MNVQLQINNSTSSGARFVSWAPSPCRIRVTNPSGATGLTVSIKITAKTVAGGGAVVFRQGTTGAFSNSLTLTVPIFGISVPFFIAGKFGSPSVNNQDVTIEAHRGTTLVGSVRIMVRVRKNANTLTPGERSRFVSAMAQLNNQGAGPFADFRDMHTNVSAPQAHGPPAFLPWHRAYLLDLERELQAIDPSVSLPYWRFDQPAPNIFTLDYLGVSNSIGTVQFSPTNPLQFWKTDNILGITRRPFFNTAAAPPGLRTEAQTLALGNLYQSFRSLEGNPHGSAHGSFGGLISSINTAARDPLFFLLHCNVDRLWAKWQRQLGRFDPAQAASYDSNPGNPIGHNLPDTMWPWNGITGGTRPPTAPGGAMAASLCVSAPGPQPRVRDALDYQGFVNSLSRMGFDYDDVRFV
ncbi:MAG: tyrosinase family protein [Saprospiraceae bacterium]|nr:tyrosinase family protein [Pyrinomonadaceae bacterium]